MTQILLRTKGWRVRLVESFRTIEKLPHAWGSHDCLVGLAGRVTVAVTGVDIATPWRGRYGSREEALNVLRSDGFASLEELVASVLPPISLGDARPGDLALVPDDLEFGGFLGALTGERLAVLGLKGMATMPRTVAARAFMVGE